MSLRGTSHRRGVAEVRQPPSCANADVGNCFGNLRKSRDSLDMCRLTINQPTEVAEHNQTVPSNILTGWRQATDSTAGYVGQRCPICQRHGAQQRQPKRCQNSGRPGSCGIPASRYCQRYRERGSLQPALGARQRHLCELGVANAFQPRIRVRDLRNEELSAAAQGSAQHGVIARGRGSAGDSELVSADIKGPVKHTGNLDITRGRGQIRDSEMRVEENSDISR